jgi:hypothetical protein
MLQEVREAASFEGLIVVAVIYFVLSTIARVGKQAGKGRRVRPPAPLPPGESPGASARSEGFSLEAVLREIERVKREAGQRAVVPPVAKDHPRFSNPASVPKPAGLRPRALPSADRKGRMAKAMDEAGPLGRHSRVRLPSAEEIEDRESLEESGALVAAARLENLDPVPRHQRVEVDQDDGAEALVQRRIKEAEARNTAFSAADHARFHEKIKQTESTPAAGIGLTVTELRQALVWREILGPPKALE